MAVKYGKKKQRPNHVIYTIITIVLLCAVFLTMVGRFYEDAEEEAYENLHAQTKQIKDDMHLQLVSDRENLATMANFAAKLYADGESYDLMFNSFKPIGLIENIGILTPENVFRTKAGEIDLNGKISFWEEAERGAYISGRVKDLTRDNYEIIRSAVPIRVGNQIVGILYGVIKLDTLSKRYNTMAKELDAQLFVYDKEKGDLVIDTVHETLGNISFLKDRQYREGTYEEIEKEEKGFVSFMSAYRNENLYLHYSIIDDIDWGISLARYESQVFARTHRISQRLFTAFFIMVFIMIAYMIIVMEREKHSRMVTACASHVRKVLLEINQQKNNISSALHQICSFSKARSAVFFDTDGENYNYIMPDYEKTVLVGEDRDFFIKELLRYAAEFYRAHQAVVNVMCITPNHHLKKTNPDFYAFVKKHNIKKALFATIIDEKNHISILGTINPKMEKETSGLLHDVAVCFSIALYNKNHLNRTEIAATTDSLTGVSNRVTYKRDLVVFDEEKPGDFSCIYIDVNELHLRNNKYGHAAGDEMLIFIANTLKEVFYGQSIYRMGGDEFLVFARNTSPEAVKENIEHLLAQLAQKDYHVAVGMSFRTQNTNTEEMVREAEVRMYEAKANYYQNKEKKNAEAGTEQGYVHMKTGIPEIDALMSVLKEHYNGIYRVSLRSDQAHRILMPAYLGYHEDEAQFSKLFKKYITDAVDSNYHRGILNFLNYDAMRAHLLAGKNPKITYKKINGEMADLCIYKLREDGDVNDTLWVFSKE